ncbi:MAG: MMPL family transporter [SAR324 cluster bacterium]|nr:MMPL family transporter [SAR324 cluster bacterium]
MREKIDGAFRSYGSFIIKYRYFVLIALIALTAFMVSGMRFLKMDSSTESFFHKTDPIMVEYEAFRDQFGRDDVIIFLIKSDKIFTREFLDTLKEFHENAEEGINNLKEVNSLINARKTVGAEGALIVGDLLEEMPETPEEMAAVKDYVMNSVQYRNFLISERGDYTAMVLELEPYSSMGGPKSSDGFGDLDVAVSTQKKVILTDQELTIIVAQAKALQAKYNTKGMDVYLTGTPIITDFLKKSMQRDMPKFIALMVGTIAVFLFVLFRRFSGVLLPLATVIFSLLYTMGLMGHLGVAITMPTMILPSFLLAVGVGASVHMMSMFYKDFIKENGNRNAAILDALEHSALPIAMTSITTAGGLMSFAGAKAAPIADLGVFSAFGVMVSLFMTLTMVPCLLSIMVNRGLSHMDKVDQSNVIDKILVNFGDWSYDHAGKVVIGATVLFAFSVMGMTSLKFSHNILEWYPKTSDIKIASDIIDAELGGATSIEIIVDAKKENGQYDPQVQMGLNKLESLAMNIKSTTGKSIVGKTSSLATMLKETNQALNENNPAHYIIPNDQATIAQEFLLFENSGSDDLERVTDSLFSKSRLTAKARWQDANNNFLLINEIKEGAKGLFPEGVTVQVTGMIVLFAETITLMMDTTVTSYLIALSLITVMMIILIGKFSTGLLSMIPNIYPIIFTLGMMGWLGIPLDMFTLLIGSIAIGLAVDDTIHFFHNFRRYHHETGSVKKAIEKTLFTAGRAMLITSLVLTTGFLLFLFATLNNLINFGLLTAFTIVMAFLSDILLAPALLTLAKGRDLE